MKIEHHGATATLPVTRDELATIQMAVALMESCELAASISGSKQQAGAKGAITVAGVLMRDGGAGRQAGFVLDPRSSARSAVSTPLTVGKLDLANGVCQFLMPDQVLSPKAAASLASVHVATVRRAVETGELPQLQITERRVGHKLSDVVGWMNSRRPQEG